MLSRRKIYWLFIKLYILSLLFMPFIEQAFALGEIFETYNSPQGVAMGNAFTAMVNGYASNFYNAAGNSSFTKKQWELNIVALDALLGMGGIGLATSTQSFGAYRSPGRLKLDPGNYAYWNFSALPSLTFRGLSFAVLASYQFAAKSDGEYLDINTKQDVIPTVGISRHLAGNLIKVGVAGKWVIRNQLAGVYDHDSLASRNDENYSSLYKEGNGFGADLGLLVTLPYKFLPTIGFAWRDMFDTRFTKSNILNSQASDSPDKIPQSFNLGFSVQPAFSRTFKATISFDYKHLEMGSLPWRKHFHAGLQLDSERSLIFWLGMNQLYPTGGLGLRVKGGNLEMGTYAVDVGEGNESKEDRRMFFRYTISF